MGSDEPRRKKARQEAKAELPAFGGGDSGLGGLYDFLPPPDPDKDAQAKVDAKGNKMTRPKLPPLDRTRVIFLDVDGVLLPSGAIDTIVVEGVQLPSRAVRESDFATTAMGSLRAIVQQTGAILVLSSEWRRTDDLRSSIGAVLRAQDIPVFKDWTPIFKPRPEIQAKSAVVAWCERRAREIGSWLKSHPDVQSWVAVDDLDFDWADNVRIAGTPWMKVRSVHTDHIKCLTDDNAAEAVRLLLNPPPEPVIRGRRPLLTDSGSTSGVLCSTEDSPPDRIRLG